MISAGRAAKHIVMTPWGSLGDLHPYLAIAIGLRERGHRVTIATSEVYRRKVEPEGLEFHAVRPDVGRLLDDAEALRRCYDLRRGTEYVVRQVVLPELEQSYQDLSAVCRNAGLVLSHPLAYSVPILAEQYGFPWISVALQPMGFLSTYDPPVIAGAAGLRQVRRLGRIPYWLVFRLASLPVRAWAEPVHALRRRVGLPPAPANPLLEGSFSPYGTLACFSQVMGAPQPDWPPRTTVTGFAFYDRLEPSAEMDPALSEFLDRGEAPVVFTLGSSAVTQAGDFYEQACAAVRRLGCRAVLLTGVDGRNRLPEPLPGNVLTAPYAPFSQLLPRAAATVHQGGIGTTAQALRAGRPMLVVPYSHDQPDNAARVARLGVARVLDRRRFSADAAANELRTLLSQPFYSYRAQLTGSEIRRQDGVAAACDAIERLTI